MLASSGMRVHRIVSRLKQEQNMKKCDNDIKLHGNAAGVVSAPSRLLTWSRSFQLTRV